jgi:tyrosinase
MDWSISRRQLIAFTSAYAVFQSQLPIPWPRAETATGRVRENIRVFAEDPEKVTALRLAIKTMKEKSANNKHDPLGWDYWAAVHGTDEAVPPNLESIYNQCVHRGTHFLSWHRAFLFYFEAVLKRSAEEAGASAQIELPYWDWYSDPVLPAIFTDQKTNPLWHPRATEALPSTEIPLRLRSFCPLRTSRP